MQCNADQVIQAQILQLRLRTFSVPSTVRHIVRTCTVTNVYFLFHLLHYMRRFCVRFSRGFSILPPIIRHSLKNPVKLCSPFLVPPKTYSSFICWRSFHLVIYEFLSLFVFSSKTPSAPTDSPSREPHLETWQKSQQMGMLQLRWV